MVVYRFERVDKAGMETSSTCSSLEEACRNIEHSYRGHPSTDSKEGQARRDPRLSFRPSRVDGGWLVEVFQSQVHHGAPLAIYKITRLETADSAAPGTETPG
jgi:hypothetical protein